MPFKQRWTAQGSTESKYSIKGGIYGKLHHNTQGPLLNSVGTFAFDSAALKCKLESKQSGSCAEGSPQQRPPADCTRDCLSLACSTKCG